MLFKSAISYLNNLDKGTKITVAATAVVCGVAVGYWLYAKKARGENDSEKNPGLSVCQGKVRNLI